MTNAEERNSYSVVALGSWYRTDNDTRAAFTALAVADRLPFPYERMELPRAPVARANSAGVWATALNAVTRDRPCMLRRSGGRAGSLRRGREGIWKLRPEASQPASRELPRHHMCALLARAHARPHEHPKRAWAPRTSERYMPVRPKCTVTGRAINDIVTMPFPLVSHLAAPRRAAELTASLLCRTIRLRFARMNRQKNAAQTRRPEKERGAGPIRPCLISAAHPDAIGENAGGLQRRAAAPAAPEQVEQRAAGSRGRAATGSGRRARSRRRGPLDDGDSPAQ
ncbi:hypothetical protein ACCO45_011951 [Purpureocillium lilacinum]|uniref:Uncharacterized protein n=1 Tax=Purpureocillium lilacinum TaxID=33203 RepID=A0ACC4DCE2_PURLI